MSRRSSRTVVILVVAFRQAGPVERAARKQDLANIVIPSWLKGLQERWRGVRGDWSNGVRVVRVGNGGVRW